MKKLGIILLVVILIAVIAVGITFVALNKEKVSMTASNFASIMQGKGYTITDAKSQFAEYDYIKQVYIASNATYSYQVEFYELSDESEAISFYNNNKSIFESYKGSSSSETSAEMKNYSKYSLSANGKYMVVSRIDNTVIFVNVDEEYKDTVKGILKELGY